MSYGARHEGQQPDRDSARCGQVREWVRARARKSASTQVTESDHAGKGVESARTCALLTLKTQEIAPPSTWHGSITTSSPSAPAHV